jgi:hypothetical protein
MTGKQKRKQKKTEESVINSFIVKISNNSIYSLIWNKYILLLEDKQLNTCPNRWNSGFMKLFNHLKVNQVKDWGYYHFNNCHKCIQINIDGQCYVMDCISFPFKLFFLYTCKITHKHLECTLVYYGMLKSDTYKSDS